MAIDFLRGWQLTMGSNPEQHDQNCSWITGAGGFICDCDFLYQHPDMISPIFWGEDRVPIIQEWEEWQI